MGRFVEAADRDQASFLPSCLEDYVDADNPVRIIDAFVDELDLADLGFARVPPASTGRPGYAPGTMLKLYVYGYLHQLTSSRKLEREAGRNIELMWLVGKLVSDFKTIADFRHDNASAIQIACQRFVAVCRALGLVGGGVVALDGSRLRAVNTHEKNYTKGKLARRKAHVEESIARYLAELEEADSVETGPATPRIERLTDDWRRCVGVSAMGKSRSPIRMPVPWQLGATIAVWSVTTSRRPSIPGIISSSPMR